MKKNSKKLMAAFLFAFTFAFFAAIPASKAQAETQKASYTLFAGQKIYYTNYETVKSAKSSNSAIVTAKKDSEYDYRTNLSAKKAGKATITIKTSSGNTAYLTVKVVKPGLSAKIVNVGEDYVIVKVSNSSILTYEYSYVQYKLKNSDGKEVDASTVSVPTILPKSSAYVSIDYNQYAYNVSKSKSKVSVVMKGDQVPTYSPNYAYTKQNNKLTVKAGKEKDNMIPVTFKNKSGLSISGHVEFVFYNSNNEIIYVSNKYISLKPKETVTENVYPPYKGFHHYKVVKNVFYHEIKE